MNDMTSVIVPKSDQINADDLIGGPITITIRDVQIKGGQEQPVSIYFDGSDKAFRPCKSMSRVLVAMWGADAKQYVGRSLTLYRDPEVKWGGMAVGGIRISHMSDIPAEKTMALTATKGSRKPFTVRPLSIAAGGNDGLDAARKAIADAPTLDALRVVWSSKAMAPYREQLQGLLDERKAALSFDQPATVTPPDEADGANQADDVAASANGPDDTERGEAVTLDSAKDQIDAAEIVADVNNRLAALRQHLNDDEADELAVHAAARIDVLKKGAGK